MLPVFPSYISNAFIATTLLTLVLFFLALRKSEVKESTSNSVTALLIGWIILLGLIANTGVLYADRFELPPRFLIIIVPPFALIAFTFFTATGRKFIDGLSLKYLTLVSIVRIPVEIILFWLALNGAIPELMTFAGRNFDILAGITAPLIFYFGYQKGSIGRKGILAWNIISFFLLLNIVGNAALSIPSPIQQFALDQPNIAVLLFPYCWLPGFIVPVVFFTHFVAFRRLKGGEEISNNYSADKASPKTSEVKA